MTTDCLESTVVIENKGEIEDIKQEEEEPKKEEINIDIEVNLKEYNPKDKRSKVVKELYTSEEIYVNHLIDIIEV